MASGGDLDVFALVPPGSVSPPHDTRRDGERAMSGRERYCGGNRWVVAVSDRLDQLGGVHGWRVPADTDSHGVPVMVRTTAPRRATAGMNRSGHSGNSMCSLQRVRSRSHAVRPRRDVTCSAAVIARAVSIWDQPLRILILATTSASNPSRSAYPRCWVRWQVRHYADHRIMPTGLTLAV